jgi:hypothetical protein
MKKLKDVYVYVIFIMFLLFGCTNTFVPLTNTNGPYIKETIITEKFTIPTPVVEKPVTTNNDACKLFNLHLKEDMPPLPKIPAGISKDGEVGDYLLKHMIELRNYIKQKDLELTQQMESCK